MILFLQISCLFFSLYTLHTYVMKETHSRVHNLLPLVMGLVCIYNLYQVILTVTQGAQILVILKDLLIIQMLYLVIFYMMNFLRMQIIWQVEKTLFLSLVCFNGGMILKTLNGESYASYFVSGMCIYDMIIAGLVVYAYVRMSYSKKERRVERWLLLAAFMPSATNLMRFTQNEVLKNECMAVAVMSSFGILLYLIKTGQLSDTESILQGNWFDKIDTPIFLFDTDYFFLNANAAAKELYPELKKNTRKRRNVPCIANIEELSKHIESNQEVELEGKYYKYTFSKQYDYGEHKGYILSMIDITNQKEEINTMEKLKHEAERQSRSKSRFLARMSHDMRGPMHSIIEVSNILAKQKDISDRNRALLSYVKDAGDIMLGLINTMLEFSKLEDGKLKLNERVYHFERMIEDLSNISVINLYSKPVHFMAKIEGEHPAKLLGDDIRVKEILQNILSNAVKFTSKGEINCNIAMCICQDERVQVTCRVRDSGPGMTKEQIQHIQAELQEYDEKREQEGYGLGLSIVMQLLAMLDGSIHFESENESGFAVTVSFYQKLAENTLYPEVEYTTESVLQKADYDEESFGIEYVYPDAKILVADDMRINREIFLEQLKPWKCEVDCVADGVMAVEAVEKKKYHLIFLDQMMPNMTGMEAARQIREKQPDVSIIMMTGDAQADLWEEAQAAGVDGYLAKPYDMTSLQSVLEETLSEELRQLPSDRQTSDTAGFMADQRAFRKVLKTFFEEIGDFEKHMKDYARNDLEAFRIKSHGVKGVCKQLNNLKMGEMAEIMEMAAKTGNVLFIAEHIDKFNNDVRRLLEQIQRDLSEMEPEEEDALKEENVDEIWRQLKEGFEQYNLDKIEKAIKQLSQYDLSDEEQDILDQAGIFSEDLEYEQGSRLLENMFVKP